MLLPQTDMSNAVAFAERLRTGIEHMEIPVEFRHLKVTVSIGVTTYMPRARLTVNELINIADSALYDAKRNGRNRVVAA